jgi:hypothetical protein
VLILTLEDQMHEYSGQAAPCTVSLPSSPCHRVSANAQILVRMSDYRATLRLTHDLMSLLRYKKKVNNKAYGSDGGYSPSPIFSLVFNTNSGVRVERCCAIVFMHKPAPRVCSPKTSTARSSTGTFEPTRSLNSQYAS